MRILHFSDFHVQANIAGIPLRELLNKRLLAAMNLKLRRWHLFAEAPRKLNALSDFAQRNKVDLAICTGDCTALGTEEELRLARACVEPLCALRLGLVMIPGNHDIYLPASVHDARFQRYFGDLMQTDMPDLTVDDRWPLVRLIEDEVAVVAVNSARPNPQPWRSSGAIPPEQLRALSSVLQHPQLQPRFVFVITHYAPRGRDGSLDTSLHGLDNAAELLDACSKLNPGALLHGHIHHPYHLPRQGAEPPIFGAGSATYQGRESIWLFELSGGQALATPGFWRDGSYALNRNATAAF